MALTILLCGIRKWCPFWCFLLHLGKCLRVVLFCLELSTRSLFSFFLLLPIILLIFKPLCWFAFFSISSQKSSGAGRYTWWTGYRQSSLTTALRTVCSTSLSTPEFDPFKTYVYRVFLVKLWSLEENISHGSSYHTMINPAQGSCPESIVNICVQWDSVMKKDWDNYHTVILCKSWKKSNHVFSMLVFQWNEYLKQLFGGTESFYFSCLSY